jgi:predicted kinase
MKQKRVFITVGVPASGKSSFIRKQIKENSGAYISRDEVRFSIITDEDDYFGKENLVFDTFVQKVQNAIDDENGPEDVYVDATHVSWGSRRKILNRLSFGNVKELVWLYFRVPVKTALARNSSRTGRSLVPETAILSMAENITKPKPNERNRVWTINKDGEVVSIE